ncbi:MAG: class I SAM-dependent methyltransferase [Candidatus Daviesbacteria bacterium]|nr:class I SAM-dependent methyltransferase [Candidatus Daviesbacteria bacterium]
MKSGEIDNYAHHTKAYSRFAGQSFSWRYIEKPAFDRNLPDSIYQNSPLIIDLGSGSGRIIEYHLLRGADPLKLTGIDASASMIETTIDNYSQVNFIHSSMQNLKTSQNSIDLVTSNLSFRYLDNQEMLCMFKKIKFMLKPEGTLFFLDVHPIRYGLANGFDRYYQETKRHVPTPWGGEDSYYYRTLSTYINTVVEAGLIIRAVDECPVNLGGQKANTNEYRKYNTPARFAILAVK